MKSLPVNTEWIQKRPCELKMDLFKVLMVEGKINQAVELTRQMDDATLIEKMHYMAKSKGLHTSKPKDEIEAFHCISNLKRRSDTIDTNLIFEVNCRQINNKPSYVFKALKHALDLAKEMDPNRKSVRGQWGLLSYEKAYF